MYGLDYKIWLYKCALYSHNRLVFFGAQGKFFLELSTSRLFMLFVILDSYKRDLLPFTFMAFIAFQTLGLRFSLSV